VVHCSNLVLALVATLLSIWFRISTALTEILVGTVAQLDYRRPGWHGSAGAKSPWIGFLAGTGAISLRFWRAPNSTPRYSGPSGRRPSRSDWSVSPAPFWEQRGRAFPPGLDCARELAAGVALSTTSIAVVYTVMLELGLTERILAKASWRLALLMTSAR